MITFFNKKMSQGSSGMWHKARAILKRIAGESVERWRGEGYLLRQIHILEVILFLLFASS